jgi:isoamyl acetate esterase
MSRQVILIGDSIRMGYQDTVKQELAGLADVWAPDSNGFDSRNVLAQLDDWVIARAPDVVHLNCGLHDIKRPFGAADCAVPIQEYEQNARRILERVTKETGARLLWASTTPVNQKWHHDRKNFDRFEADVTAYNRAAAHIASDLAIPLNDLYATITAVGRDLLLQQDGVHFTPEGCALLGRKVADFVRQYL